MALHLFLTFACFLGYAFLLRRWWDRQAATLPFQWVLGAYLFRIALGLLYGFIYLKFYQGDDTWYFNRGAEEEFRKLMQDPLQFFRDPDPVAAFAKYPSFSENWYYYLSDLEFWMITKPLALVYVITGGNYYLNVVFFNALTLWGSLWLYRFIARQLPHFHKTAFFWLCFFPPLVFWWSGIRADGLLLMFSALLLTCFGGLLQQGGSRRFWAGLLIGITGIIILRSVLLLVWIPALTCWYLHHRSRLRPWKMILGVYGVGLLLFFGSALVSPNRNLPNIVVHRQQEFFKLDGKTRFQLDSLAPDPLRFLEVAPQAVEHTLLRPYLWEAKGPLQWLTAGDVLLMLLLLLYIFWKGTYPGAGGTSIPPELLYPALFGFTLYLFIGYTIPFPGAIVRYKVQGEIFLWLLLTEPLTRRINHIK